jgi:hypothetical protein
MIELETFMIDTVQPIEVDEDGEKKSKVRMVRYTVLGSNAEHALNRFFNEEAGEIVEETEPNDLIVVGFGQPGKNGFV